MKIIIIISLIFLVSCNGGPIHNASTGNSQSVEFTSNGEGIYFTGTSASGSPINARGGDGAMSMHRQMHGGGCASCHGADRKGQRLWPRFWIKAPALTVDALFGDDDHENDSNDHGDHSKYNADLLRLAITNGQDPAGNDLDQAMPRWSMSPSDMDDLINFLMQTHSHD